MHLLISLEDQVDTKGEEKRNGVDSIYGSFLVVVPATQLSSQVGMIHKGN